MQTTAHDLPAGTAIDRYRIEGPVGEGGFGAVYRARHAVLGHAVAIKVLHPEHASNEETLERFFREARAAAKVGSPHIVKVTDCGTSADGRPFLVMELLEGEGLDAVLRRAAPLAEPRAIRIALQVLDALGAAHQAGIVHRDLKPANVFLAKDPADGGDFVKLVDFGISKVGGTSQSPSLTRTGVVLGTPMYMAPEQFRGARDVDHRVDLYATAALLYEMLSGQLPHTGETYADLAVNVMSQPARPLAEVAPAVSRDLAAAVDRGLATEPATRWSDAASFSVALRRASQALPAVVPADRRPDAVPAAPAGLAAASRVEPAGPPTGPGTGPASQPSAPPASQGALQAPARTPRRSRGLLWIVIGVVGLALLAALGGGAAYLVVRDRPTRVQARPGARPQPFAPPQPLPPPPPQPGQTGPGDPFAQLGTAFANALGQVLGAPGAPAAPAELQIYEPRIGGGLSPDAVRQVLVAARPSLESCRPQGQAAYVRAQIQVVRRGRITVAGPAPGNPGPADVAQCCADRFRQAVPQGWDPGSNGVIFFDVLLPAR
jgi:serine/threonine-protein kinase